MLRLVLLSALLACGSAMSAHDTIKRDLQNFNNEAVCWGIGNSMKWHVGIMLATEQCEKISSGSTLPGSLRPTNPFTTLPASSNNPFTTLPGDASNPWMNVPQPINNRINPLRQLVSRGSVGNSAAKAWTNMWADFMGGRNKRQAEEGEGEEEDIEQFLEDFKDFKHDMVSKMKTLTCVLTKMNMLDAQMQVNLEYFTEQMWTQFDLKQTIAGEDPAWRQKVSQGYTDCHQIASNWPQQSLDRNPITKVFGRHMIFFKCSMKMEKKNCAKAQLHSWLATLYGDSDDFNWAEAGLPQDKYDRAALSVMVMHEAASEEEKFVGDFFNSEHHM